MEEQKQPENVGLYDAAIALVKECEAKLTELVRSIPYKTQPHFIETYNRVFVGAMRNIYTDRTLLRDLPAHRKNEQVFIEHQSAGILLENKILLDFDVVVNDLAQTELDLANHTQELADIQDVLLVKAGARSKVTAKDAEEKNARGINLKELLQKGADKIAKLREWVSQNADKVLQAIEKAQAAGEKIWALVQNKFQDARLTMLWVKKILEGKFDVSPELAPVAPVEIIVNPNETQNGTAEELPSNTAE